MRHDAPVIDRGVFVWARPGCRSVRAPSAHREDGCASRIGIRAAHAFVAGLQNATVPVDTVSTGWTAREMAMPEDNTRATGRFWCGVAALGLWLGWTASTFAALSGDARSGVPAPGDISASIMARLAAEGMTATAAPIATAYVLAEPACACPAADDAATDAGMQIAALADALATLDIPLVDLRTRPDDPTRSYTVALFDAHGALRYAGPPGFSLGCMRGAIASSATIARLLQGSQAVLVPTLPCSC